MQQLEQLKRDLTENLLNHVKGERRPGSAWSGISLRECEEREKIIKDKYLTEIDAESIERVQCEVNANVFAYSRRQVEKCFQDLERNEHALYDACRIMCSELFYPLYNRMSYDAADWFASLGGVQRLMAILKKTFSKFCSLKDLNIETLCTEALVAMRSFASSDGRISMANDHGLLDLIVKIMCDTKIMGRLKSECVHTISSFLDDRMWQVKIVQAGALRPVLDMVLDPETRLTVIDSALSGVSCCAVNSAVLDFMVKENVAAQLFYLAKNVRELHRDEIIKHTCVFRGIDVMGFLPLHISYLCYVTVSLLLHQHSLQHWQRVIDEIRRKGRPHDSITGVIKTRPLTEVDKQMLRAVRSFTSEIDPIQVEPHDLSCLVLSCLYICQSVSTFSVHPFDQR